MPNHITSVVTVTGPEADVERFIAAHVVPDDGGHLFFDLRTVVPKPASVEATTSGSESDTALFALTGKPGKWTSAHEALWLYGRHYGNPATREELLATLCREHPNVLARGVACLIAHKETGYFDWYEWSYARWGTKRNVYRYEERAREPGRFVFKMETANGFPEPVFHALAARYPSVTFAAVAFDEGWCNGREGEFNGAADFRRVKATDELYERVYGRKYEREPEDEPEPDDEDEGAAPTGGAQ